MTQSFCLKKTTVFIHLAYLLTFLSWLSCTLNHRAVTNFDNNFCVTTWATRLKTNLSVRNFIAFVIDAITRFIDAIVFFFFNLHITSCDTFTTTCLRLERCSRSFFKIQPLKRFHKNFNFVIKVVVFVY